MRWFVLAGLLLSGSAFAATEPAVEARQGMVVTAQHLATDVGTQVLRDGGNAIDAAVAVGYALAVVNPCCGNIGGGGFMTIHLADGRDTFLDFRESAPAAATAAMYQDAAGNVVKGASLYGYLAVPVPGSVLGLETARARYGTLPRPVLMAPAIRLARDGFVLTRGDTDILTYKTAAFRKQANVAAIFLRPDGSPWQPGERLVQADLAHTLEAISVDGTDAFYKGEVARATEAASRANGGIITAVDFAGYKVVERTPVRCTYRGYVVVSAPPPSSGGTTMCEIMNVLEGYDMKASGFHSAQSVHVMVEAMRHAYVDRNSYLGDPDYVKNPLDRLLSKEYAARVRQAIVPEHATASVSVEAGVAPHERTETTQYSVMDAAGNAVSVTYSLNGAFGAVVIPGRTGVLLGDTMDDFTIKPGVANLYGLVQGQANAIAPGKRPLSSMAPSLVTRDGHVAMVVGSPGGSRIITITLETILNMIDYGMEPQEATDAPRLHHQWMPDVVYTEPFALSLDTRRILEGWGYKFVEQAPWGAAEVVAVGGEPPTVAEKSGGDAAMAAGMRAGLLYGANDDRRPAGAASGY